MACSFGSLSFLDHCVGLSGVDRGSTGSLHFRGDLDLALVDNRRLGKVAQARGWCKFTPCVVVHLPGRERHARRLDEWHETPLVAWVEQLLARNKAGTGAVELTPQTMAYLERSPPPSSATRAPNPLRRV